MILLLAREEVGRVTPERALVSSVSVCGESHFKQLQSRPPPPTTTKPAPQLLLSTARPS